MSILELRRPLVGRGAPPDGGGAGDLEAARASADRVLSETDPLVDAQLSGRSSAWRQQIRQGTGE